MQHILQTEACAKIRPNFRRLALWFMLCVIACVGSGCVRIGQELTKPPIGSDYDKPGNRFYMGSHVVLEGSAWFGPFIILLPGELIADTFFLPLDCLRYAYFKLNPPLAYYIEQNDLEVARKKLEAGADPNKIDYRVSYVPPVVIAKERKSIDSLKLLIDHGANKIPPQFFIMYFNEEQFLLDVFKNHLLDGIEWKESAKGLILNWIPRRLDANELDYLNKRTELITILLEQGLSPNDMDEKALKERKTALDVLLGADYNGLDKSKLINLLKSYGAMTYPELSKKQTKLPHLDKKELDINPFFKSFVEKLEMSRESENYILSTSYPGMDCPVLVIDRKLKWKKTPKDPEQVIYRTSRIVHKRKTPTEWNQIGEPFELPAHCRIVLTPPGRKMPSRLHDGIPTACMIHEEWYSLPEYEAYAEQLAFSLDYNIESYYDNDALHLLRQEHGHEKQQRKKERFDPSGIQTLNLVVKHTVPKYKSTWEESRWMNKASVLLKAAGVEGNWLAIKPWPRIISYTFDTHRKTEDIPQDAWEIVPYPNEIMIVINQKVNQTPNAKDTHWQSPDGRNGKYYWNWHFFHWPQKGSITILYGDEVSEETIEKIKNCLYEIM